MHRPAFLAGRWYPGDPEGCRAAIEAHGRDTTPAEGDFRGLIGPHAGWAFSGDCVGRGYRWLAGPAPAAVELAVVFGSHRGPTGPNTVFLEEAWDTPLGALRNAQDLAVEIATTLSLDEEPAQPLHPDNAVELHLPFVRAYFPNAALLMVGVEASRRALAIGRSIGELVRAREREAIFVGSTDLTHYGPNYGFSPAGSGNAAVHWVREVNDRGFLDALLAADPGAAVDHAREQSSACCPGAAAAAFEAVRAYRGEVDPRLVDHYLSCDVRPDRSFVGYASVVF